MNARGFIWLIDCRKNNVDYNLAVLTNEGLENTVILYVRRSVRCLLQTEWSKASQKLATLLWDLVSNPGSERLLDSLKTIQLVSQTQTHLTWHEAFVLQGTIVKTDRVAQCTRQWNIWATAMDQKNILSFLFHSQFTGPFCLTIIDRKLNQVSVEETQ